VFNGAFVGFFRLLTVFLLKNRLLVCKTSTSLFVSDRFPHPESRNLGGLTPQ
jgi:hypothetical protein